MKKWLSMAIVLMLAGSTVVLAETPYAAAVRQKGHWGVINGVDSKVIPLTYDKVGLSLIAYKKSTIDSRQEDMNKNKELGLIEVEAGKVRGFYDRQGKTVVPVSYDRRSSWNDRILLARTQGKYGYYGSDGQVIAAPQYDSAAVFSENLAGVGKGGQYGYIDKTGTVVIPLQYEEAGTFVDGRAVVRKQGLWGIIDNTGREILPCTYDAIQPVYEGGYIGVKKNDLWGFVDKNGKVVLAPQYKNIISNFAEGYAAVETSTGLTFVALDGKALPVTLKDIYGPFQEGLAPVRFQDGTKGYIDTTGKTAIKANYTELGGFQNGLAQYIVKVAQVRPVGGIGIGISIGGNSHYGSPVYMPSLERSLGVYVGGDPYYDESEPYYGYHRTGVGISLGAELKRSEHRGYLDKTGRIIANANMDYVCPMTENGTLVTNHGLWGYVRRDGAFLVPLSYRSLQRNDDLDLFIAENEDGSYGAISTKTGQTTIPFTYEELRANGPMLSYRVGKKWGLMSRDGQLASQAIFDEIGRIEENRVLVKRGAIYSYVDMTGKTLFELPPNISKAGAFMNGYAPIMVNGKWGLIDGTGKITAAPVYDRLQVL